MSEYLVQYIRISKSARLSSSFAHENVLCAARSRAHDTQDGCFRLLVRWLETLWSTRLFVIFVSDVPTTEESLIKTNAETKLFLIFFPDPCVALSSKMPTEHFLFNSATWTKILFYLYPSIFPFLAYNVRGLEL